ncbi:hypothetical protein CC77DRAFT_1095782 [Alternaria alternata]|uniref:Uncharacterized protein n=1 Tax=Alternaria alternata TaxID=5599 RepID=A0A177DH99_ALTAL|nr:hypothetical protein CC77DRAFT_1095782 [Alternaria alternata]XP_051593750.1 uncharacterized protein J4E82_000246 [Alternaria postmessia]KAI5381047.1 hypothetical protein J4E82_000246 [Alternaria postmessia]OAG19274.1 hypothetical protein CC77DRAFT_1095782 [Alternaria alternata]
MTVSVINTLAETALSSLVEQDHEVVDFEDAQSISGRNIDPDMLTMLLRVKFGAGAYDIHVNNAELILYHRSAKIVKRGNSEMSKKIDRS